MYTEIMVILIHIIIALSSIIIATLAFFKPSSRTLIISYGFIIATIASGTYLLITVPSHILQSCLTGLGYLTVISLVMVATHVRLNQRTQF